MSKGDTTDLTVPDALIITSQSFEIRDVNTNRSHYPTQRLTKTIREIIIITLTMSKHSDTQGSLMALCAGSTLETPSTREVESTVNGETRSVGRFAKESETFLHYQKLVG